MGVDYREIRIGVELETIGRTRMQVAEAVRSVVGGGEIVRIPSYGLDAHEFVDDRGRKWRVVTDDSLINAQPHLRAEINTPILSFDDLPDLQEVARAVRRAGARVDERTAVHIHTSHPDLNARAAANLARIFHKNEDLIFAAFGVTHERMERYAKKMRDEFARKIAARKPGSMNELNKWWYGRFNATPTRQHDSRYAALNLNALIFRNAVEFRLFQFKSNRIHAGELRAWIIFCMALTAKAINTKAASARKRNYDADCGKFDFRVFISHGLGLHGPEHHNVRMHLLARLQGDSAWKNPERRRTA
ncbi:MAG: amidoligase family protein [bacterium]